MRIGVDVGGTKIEAIALDGDRVVARRRVPAARGDYDGTLDVIARLVNDLRKETGPHATIGVGIPGAISTHSGLVKNANSIWLIGKPFDRDLARVLDAPVRVANDANCFALSEATDGAARDAHTVFGVILGTGTGGGIVVEGRILEGRHRIAGEWGHNPLPWPAPDETPGPACYCGRSGCIETFLSGCGLTRAYHALTSETLDAQEIASRAGSNRAAAAALDIYENRLARALAHVINILDPDVIVAGGGLSNIDRLYAHVPALWAPYVFSDRADTPFVKAVHGDSSGVRGAAWLW